MVQRDSQFRWQVRVLGKQTALDIAPGGFEFSTHMCDTEFFVLIFCGRSLWARDEILPGIQNIGKEFNNVLHCSGHKPQWFISKCA